MVKLEEGNASSVISVKQSIPFPFLSFSRDFVYFWVKGYKNEKVPVRDFQPGAKLQI